jgi:hypothetical protein
MRKTSHEREEHSVGYRFPIVAPSGRHRTTEANRRTICRLAILLVTAAALAFPGLARAAQLSVVPNGPEGVAVTVDAGGVANPPCTALALNTTRCDYTYAGGTTVTLRATAAQFAGWSDVRCGPAPTCTLTLDEEATTVAASYAVQRVWVRIAGAGTVAPVGRPPCAVDPNDPTTADCGLFPLGSRVTLAGTPANAPAPRWQRALSNPERPLCDDPPGVDATADPTCPIDVNGLRWGNVAFDGEPFSPAVPSSVSVRFRILKVGNGAGTVRSGALDCGSRCTVERIFGNRETLVADPGSGSRFVRWRGACDTTPRCSLAVGPVTAISAEFQATGGSPSSTAPRARALVARIARVSVRGRGRRQTVVATVGVNARAKIRVDLLRGRRVAATRRRTVKAGRSVVRLRVPRRARPGAYRVQLTARGAGGQTAKAARSVRLRR